MATNIMTAKTNTGAGSFRAWNNLANGSNQITFQATVSGTGAVSATVDIEVSNDGVNVVDTVAGTIALSGTTSDSDGITVDAPWGFWRANVTAISGTGAAVTVTANGAISHVG